MRLTRSADDEAKDHARDADRALDEAEREVSFTDVVQDVSRRHAGLGELAQELSRARARGWAWDPEWEGTLDTLRRSAERTLDQVRTETSSSSARMRPRIDAVRSRLSRTSVSGAHRATLQQLESDADGVRRDVSSEEQRLRAIAEPFTRAYDALSTEVREAHVHLDRFDAAKFALVPGEHPWLTAEAAWQDAPSGAVAGFLYLSDKRVRFERKETVATKKFLFVTTASEEKHELLIDEPVGNIARSDDSTKGLLFKDQLVTLAWANPESAALRGRGGKTTFDLNSGGTAKEWDTRIEELRSGQLAHRLAGTSTAPASHGMPVDAPTVCAGCSAALDAPVRGMTVLVCKYCGQRHDLRFA